jgi:glucose-6-phosphate 1-epimerase
MDISDLARRFDIAGRVRIIEGKGGFAMVEMSTEIADAVISTYAGQVLSFRRKGQADVMFVSDTAYYAAGKAIKGGAPVCWPWFGADPEGKGRPAHGFVRNRAWDLLGSEILADGRVQVRLGLSDSDDTRAIWPHAFTLELQATIGASLELALVTTNRGEAPFDLGQALHTYFRVGDIGKVRVHGLDACPYIDKMDGGAEKIQAGAVAIHGETDRVYGRVLAPLQIEDAALARRIDIKASGSTSAVVWNPWVATAKAMADLGDDDYRVMICVETTNAGNDIIRLAPGAEHRMSAEYSITGF